TSRLKMERFIVEDFKNEGDEAEAVYDRFRDRLRYGLSEAGSIVRKLWAWVLLGVGIGAFIHGFIPDELINTVLEKTGIFSVPLAALIGVPIYANCSAVIPIAVVLFKKGVPLGTALAFMMATSALSLPEAVILRRVMKLPLIMTFFTMVTVGIIIIGYALNMIY
ncbi:permease, partial [Candidatus Altiarchaeota archaeon]